MKLNQKKYISNLISTSIKFDESMKNHTTFGIGGPAKCIVYPYDCNELSTLLAYTSKENIAIHFLGSGSNILVWDSGYDGIIISLKKTFKKLLISSNYKIKSDTGVMLGNLVKEAIKRNIKGLESLIGVPGTLGGALIMNAGAYGNEISNYISEVETITLEGKLKKYRKGDLIFSYRKSNFPRNEILINATFNCIKGNEAVIKKEKLKVSKARKEKQPLKFRSAGSIFKNPSRSIAAGYLIDKSGLKGKTKGGACISNKHGNFILNVNNASANDVFYLICLAKETVAKKFNIDLELEIKLLGFPKSMLNSINYV